jgi:hypothetical protein
MGKMILTRSDFQNLRVIQGAQKNLETRTAFAEIKQASRMRLSVSCLNFVSINTFPRSFKTCSVTYAQINLVHTVEIGVFHCVWLVGVDGSFARGMVIA